MKFHLKKKEGREVIKMKVIEIKVSDKDIDKITLLGAIPWTKINDDERQEYERMIRRLGTEVAYKITRSEWKEV